MNRSLKKIVMVFLIMLFSMNVVTNAKEINIKNPIIQNNIVTWDSIYFGNYYQTNENYKEPIKWRVLSVDGEDAFIISDQSLDCRPFADTEKGASWENSTIRKWLNNDFYKCAFNDEEQLCIKETDVINNDYYTFYQGDVYGIMQWGTNEGYYTKDKVYLLSIEEARNYKYGFSVSEMAESQESNPTDYAKSIFEKNKSWMLRSLAPEHGSKSNDLKVMQSTEVSYTTLYSKEGEKTGAIVLTQPIPQDRDNYIRPVLHINLSSDNWQYAGTVNAEWKCGKHTFEVIKTIDSTNKAEGEIIYKCSICGETKSKIIPKKINTQENITKENVSQIGNNIVEEQNTNKLSRINIKKIRKLRGTSIKITFSKVNGAKFYQIEYATNKKFKKSKTKKCNTSQYVLKNLKKGKVYYIRMRAVSGIKKGKWSKIKRVKLK